jgi:hypothetical protein
MIVLTVVATGAFAAKTVWEIATGGTLFVDPFASTSAFEPIAIAHALGGGVGLAAALWPAARPQK